MKMYRYNGHIYKTENEIDQAIDAYVNGDPIRFEIEWMLHVDVIDCNDVATRLVYEYLCEGDKK